MRNSYLLHTLIDKCRGFLCFTYRYFSDVFARSFEMDYDFIRTSQPIVLCPIISPAFRHIHNFTTKVESSSNLYNFLSVSTNETTKQI